MGIETKKQRSDFEEWLGESGSAVDEHSAHCIAVHVPRSGIHNGKSIAGAVTVAFFSREERDELEEDDETIGPFDGEFVDHLSPKGARDLAAALLRAADASEAYTKTGAGLEDSRELRFSVRCDGCDGVMRTEEQTDRFPTRETAVAAAEARGWRCHGGDDDDVLCYECRGEPMPHPDHGKEPATPSTGDAIPEKPEPVEKTRNRIGTFVFQVTREGTVFAPGAGLYEATSFVRAAEMAHEAMVVTQTKSEVINAEAFDAQDWVVRCMDGSRATTSKPMLVTTRIDGARPKAMCFTAL